MNNHPPLLEPLPPAQWDTLIQPIANALGDPLNIHRIIAHNPLLMHAYAPLREHLVRSSTLTPRQRELLILRTARNCQSSYEWTHHVQRGGAAGITVAEIERVQGQPIDAMWEPAEAVLLHCADEMFTETMLSQPTQAVLANYYTKPQILDILFTIGLYITLGTILRSFAVPLESIDEE